VITTLIRTLQFGHTKMKKPFKETKVGKLLSKASGLLPESGILGVLKQVIDTDDTLSPEEKEEAHRALIEAYKAEVADRDSARSREVGVAQAGKKDYLMFITGMVGLLSFVFVIYATVYVPSVLDNDLFVHLMGMIEGVVVSNLFAYYFGTSMKDSK
jgi:hypothetical protein